MNKRPVRALFMTHGSISVMGGVCFMGIRTTCIVLEMEIHYQNFQAYINLCIFNFFMNADVANQQSGQ